MTLRSLLEPAAGWLSEAARAIQAAEEIPALRTRIAELEARLSPPAPSAEATYTYKPNTWPKRQAKGTDKFPARGQKEYDSDEVDLQIAIAVLRHDPQDWEAARELIAARRRLTMQQVAELKARITRLRLLDAA